MIGTYNKVKDHYPPLNNQNAAINGNFSVWKYFQRARLNY